LPQRALSGIVSRMWKREPPATLPMDYETGATHFFVIENVSNESPPNDKESDPYDFVNSIFDFDA
ncbi:7275_t:CDS:2, partial [Racocetra fulgida]